jgi:hypothetical protein
MDNNNSKNNKHKLTQSLDTNDDEQPSTKLKLIHEKPTICTLNISGVKFQCDPIIFQRFPDTVLGRMFTHENSSLIHETPEGFFFDRDPDIFKHIINWYRTGILSNVLFSNDQFDYDILQHELKAWGIILHSIQTKIDLEENDDDDEKLNTTWTETRLFFENFIKSEEFTNELPNLYFQNVESLSFNKYYNKNTEQWCMISDYECKLDDDKKLETIITKYWTQVKFLDPLLYEIYSDVFFEEEGNTELSDAETLDPILLSKAIKVGKNIKIAPTFTRLLYHYTNVDDTPNNRTLIYLKRKIVSFFNNNGYKAVWKKHITTCCDGSCNLRNYISNYPFNMNIIKDGDFDLRRYPLYWSDECVTNELEGHKFPSQKIVPYLEITF